MSKILAQGMITLTQLYEGAQVILTPAAVLIPCDSNETPKPNAYINAFTNVKVFLGTMDITSGITLGALEYSDSTVRASKAGTKVSITAITTRTGYVDIPVSATIDGETIDLGKHRFSFVKQIDGQTGQPGIQGDPGFSYTLNIKGGTRGIAYAANGTNPEPNTSSQFSVELLKNGVKVANPASISWTCGGNLSGSSSAATFTPTIKSTYNAESSYVKVSVKEFAASLAVEETIPIICTKHADGLDWINEWNNKYVQVGTEKIITPKIFAGTKNSANELTGVAIGRDVLGGNANKVIGIVGYKKNTPVFSLDQDANFFVSSSGSAGDIKNGTNNAKGLYFDGNDLYISGRVRINGGSTIGKDNILVEDVINNSNLGAQANNKLDNLSIGGTNLAYDTNKGATAWGWGIQTNGGRTITDHFADGINGVKMVKDGTAGSGWSYVSYGRFKRDKITPATTYVVSFEMKSNLTFNVGSVNLMNGNATDSLLKSITAVQNKVTANSNTWTKIVFKLVTLDTLPSSTAQVIYISGIPYSANATHYFRNLKLEVGNTATAWSPAPEDVDSNIDDVKNSLNSFQNTVNTTFKDGIIEEAEAKAIAQHLKTLDAEKADIDKEYSTIYGNSLLGGAAKTNLANAKTSFDSAHSSLKSTINTTISDGKVTSTEKANVDSTFTTYSGVLGTYKQRVQEALDAISSAKVNNVQIGGRNLFLNSGFTKGLNYWYTYNCSNPQAVADSSALSGYAVKFTSTGGGIYQRKGGASNNPTNYPNGSVMTVSGYVKSSVANKVLRPNFENGGTNTSKNITCTNADTWYYFTHTHKIASNGFHTITFYGDSGADYYLKDVILEYGNKASTWTPAPEDVDAEITAVNNKADNAQSTANTVNTTVNNNKDNWSNAYNRVKEWARGAVTGSVDIDGGKIAANTIIAEKIAIGDFNNYCVLPFNKTAGGPNGGTWQCYYIDKSTLNHSTLSNKLTAIKQGDKFRVTGILWCATAGQGVSVLCCMKDSSGSLLSSTTATYKVTSASTYESFSLELSVPSIPTKFSYASFKIQLTNDNSPVWVYGLGIHKMASGELIVDGAVTTNHIHTNGLNANVIKAGTISADRLDANTIVSKVNGGTTEINGNRIQTGTLSASKITTGTLDANKVKVTNLNASNITSGTIDASKISVTNLNASNITSGTLGSGYNLLKNSKGKNGTAYWLNNGGGISVVGDNTFGTCFQTSAPSGIKHSEAIKLKNNTEYVYEGYIYSRTTIGGSTATPLHYWCNTTPNTSGQSQLTVLDYRQAVPTVNKWTKCYVHFRTASSGDVYFTPFVYVGGSTTFDFWVTELSLSESSVESKWTPHPEEIYEGSTIIDATGVTINNGALRVKNNSGTTVLEGDSDGNLTLKGKVINGYNGLSTSIDRGGVNFESTGEKVGYIRSAAFGSNRAINGVVIGNYIEGDFVDLGYGDKNVHTDNTTYIPQIRLTKHATELTGNFAGVQIKDNTRVDAGKKLLFKNDTAYDSEIYASATGHLNIYGDNGFNLGYRSGSSNVSAIQMDESSDSIFFKSNMRDYKNGTSYKVLSRFEHGSVEKYAPRIQNMNAYLDSGWYSFGTDCSGTPTSWGIMLTIRAFSTDFCQIVHGTNNVLYIRWYVNGNYTSWKIW